MSATEAELKDAQSVLRNQCPDCGNWGFHGGPRGGAAQNIFCANPGCRSGFNVCIAISGPVMCQRIGQGGMQFYPPKVHIMRGGFPLCAFTIKPPSVWPLAHRGHSFVMMEQRGINKDVTCEQCKTEAAAWLRAKGRGGTG